MVSPRVPWAIIFPGVLCVYMHMPHARPPMAAGRGALASEALPAPSLGQWASLLYRTHTRIELTSCLDPAD